jgi:putative hydrolase
MNAEGPADQPNNPFAGIPMFGDLANMLANQGPLSWDAARQFALSIATDGKPEFNVDPARRIELEALARIADMHVADLTGLDTAAGGRSPEIVPVTPGVWAQHTLDAYRPIFEKLATALRQTPAADDTDNADLASHNLMAGLQQMMAPMILGMNAGSLVGHLATRSFGQYHLPIPRLATAQQPGHQVEVLIDRVDAFADDWSLRRDDVRLWVCVHELTLHALLAVPHVRAALTDLLTRHAATFRPDPDALSRAIDGMELHDDANPAGALQQMLGRPDLLLGASSTPEQERLVPQLDALVAFVVGYVDHIVDAASARLIGSGSAVAEAVRRRRNETSSADHYAEHLLGLRLGRSQVERGQAFVKGVIERAGEDGIRRAWEAAGNLPTPAEIDAPGLWLARLDLGAA